MLKFYVRHGKKVDKVHDIKSFKQHKWLKKYKTFITQKRNQAANDFDKDFYKLLNNAFYDKTKEIDRNGCKIEFINKDGDKKLIKQQSNLAFDETHISYTFYDSYILKQNGVLMDKPIFLRNALSVKYWCMKRNKINQNHFLV